MNSEKYLFVSYTNTDYEQIDNILLELYKNNIPTKETKDAALNEVDSLIVNAEAVMVVISSNSINSTSLQYHINLATQYNKHIIPYVLDDIYIPSSMLKVMDGSATIPAYGYNNTSDLVLRAIDELKPYFPDSFNTAPKKKKPIIPILCIILLVCIGIMAYAFWYKPSQQNKIFQNIKKSTAMIYSYIDDGSESGKVPSSGNIGSGFFINVDGTLITNYHVVDDVDTFLIHPSDEKEGRYYTSTLVKYDKVLDIAILKINNSYTVTNFLEISYDDVAIGDSVYVCGYPKGYALTLSNGIISNDNHTAETMDETFYLTTAAVSPGNSGGPVVNENGKVIGIATAKYINAENVNLVRPITYLKNLLNN